ncbi:MAG: hypothetical protein WA400_06100 [Silvibacterium sp.]
MMDLAEVGIKELLAAQRALLAEEQALRTKWPVGSMSELGTQTDE